MKIFVCLLIIFLAVTALLLPNSIVDTRSCKRNWIVILSILISALAIVDKDVEALCLSVVLFAGIFINCWVWYFGKIKVDSNERRT